MRMQRAPDKNYRIYRQQTPKDTNRQVSRGMIEPATWRSDALFYGTRTVPQTIREHVHQRLGPALRAKETVSDIAQDAVMEVLRFGPKFQVS